MVLTYNVITNQIISWLIVRKPLLLTWLYTINFIVYVAQLLNVRFKTELHSMTFCPSTISHRRLEQMAYSFEDNFHC